MVPKQVEKTKAFKVSYPIFSIFRVDSNNCLLQICEDGSRVEVVDKPVVGANPRNPQDPNLEGTQNSILEYQYSIIKTFLKYFCSFWFKGLKLCPKTHPYAYRNGTACCGGPGYGNQIPGIEDLCYTHPLKILPNITSSPRNSNRPWFDT